MGLDFVEVVMATEEEFEIEVPGHLDGLSVESTVRDFAALVQGWVAAQRGIDMPMSAVLSKTAHIVSQMSNRWGRRDVMPGSRRKDVLSI